MRNDPFFTRDYVSEKFFYQERAEKIHEHLLSRSHEPIWDLEDAKYLLSLQKGNYTKEDMEWLLKYDSPFFAR